MRKRGLPLTTRMFLAIAATAVLVVAIMAGMVAVSMRDGFSRYLLRGEIARFDDLIKALGTLYETDPTVLHGFAEDHGAWYAFIGQHFRPEIRARPLPGRKRNAIGPRVGPPRDPVKRLFLLDAGGDVIVTGRPIGGVSVTRPVQATDGVALIGYIGLATPDDEVGWLDSFFIRGMYLSLALASFFALAISAVVALILARGLLAPIKALEIGARTLSGGQYAVRIPNGRHDELGDLIDHYNVLAESLEAAELAERQWVSNTSHELQTPLAVLRAEIEALQDGVRKPDIRTLGEMHAAVLRLSQLVHDLKVLSFAREGQLVTSVAPHDLTEIACEAVDSMTGRADLAGLLITCDIDQALVAACDSDRIRQVVDNIIENALRYTAAPGKIVITGSKADGLVTLAIDDTAPAPDENTLAHLFERFFRAEQSRTRDAGGSGLGLAICRAIIEAHGGKITVALSPLGGLRVKFSLPEAEISNA